MSTSITQAEINVLTNATYSKSELTAEQLAALRTILARAVADDGPTIAELPAHWLCYAAQLERDMYKEVGSYSSLLRGMVDALRGAATDLGKALERDRG